MLEAGKVIPFTHLQINMRNKEVIVHRVGQDEPDRFHLVHDAFFFNHPEVTYHADAKQITVQEGTLTIESWTYLSQGPKADRICINYKTPG